MNVVWSHSKQLYMKLTYMGLFPILKYLLSIRLHISSCQTFHVIIIRVKIKRVIKNLMQKWIPRISTKNRGLLNGKCVLGGGSTKYIGEDLRPHFLENDTTLYFPNAHVLSYFNYFQILMITTLWDNIYHRITIHWKYQPHMQ